MLNPAALQQATLRRHPYPWAVVSNLVSPAGWRELLQTFPSTHFCQVRRDSGSNKTYQMSKRPLVQIGNSSLPVDDLSPAWTQLMEDAKSSDYRQGLETLTGLRLDSDLLELTVNRYGSGGFVSPHVDHAQKALTQWLYFSEDWDRRWGGCLRVLSEQNADAVVEELPPSLGLCVVLPQSELGWHSVTAVDALAPRPRLTLEIEFWREPPLRRTAGLQVRKETA